MRHYIADFKEEPVADLYFQCPIEKWNHIINDIKGDFINRLKKDNISWTKIIELSNIAGNFVVGFVAVTNTSNNGYIIKEETK